MGGYAYAANNPITLSDPSGLHFACLPGDSGCDVQAKLASGANFPAGSGAPMAALYLEPQSPVNPHTFLGALSLMLGGAAKPILDVAGCATGWGCGGLRADANPLNWAKGIAGAVTSLASDIAHGHFGGAAGTLVGMLAVGGDDPAAGLAPRAITAAPERLALPAAPERLALTAGVGARTTVLGAL